MKIITEQTLAIIQDENGYFNTRIIQGKENRYSTYTALQILEYNTRNYGSSLKGRLDFSKSILRINSKLPVPIFPEKGIFMFPTTSSKRDSCIWLSYYQIKDYLKSGALTRVYFINGLVKVVNISYYQFDLQMKRMSHVIAQYNSPFLDQH